MDGTSTTLKPWVTFAGCVLVIFVLYWAQAVLVPLGLAVLFTFVLTPPTTWLQRFLGRVPAVLTVVTLVFTVLVGALWGLTRQVDYLAADLPRYRTNIREKIRDVRGVGRGGSVEKLQETLEGIRTDLNQNTPAGERARPVIVAPDPAVGFSGFGWISPLLEPAAMAGLVITLVIFMLIERRELRDRVIALFGHGQLTITTKALDEAATRVAKQLLMQSIVNVIYGAAVAVGMYLLGVPYALLWGALGAGLRFVPYVGPLAAAAAPILVSLAAVKGWRGPFEVMGFFMALELFTNMVLETALYAGAAGVSQVALLVSVAFWTWLWGPLGLLMATPLTVCLVVVGKHVPGMRFIGTLMADEPALAPEYGYYQRLLAHDQSEAFDVIEQYVKNESARGVYDNLLLPALNYAERDRVEGRLTLDEEGQVVDATRELLNDTTALVARTRPELQAPAGTVAPLNTAPLAVLGYAVNGAADELALAMLAEVVRDLPVRFHFVSTRMQAASLAALVQEQQIGVVCLADLPPSPSSKSRYFVKRLAPSLPDVPIVVGRWAPPLLADENVQALRDAGAQAVFSTLEEARTYLGSQIERAHLTSASSGTNVA